ncbi:hypothetical protein W01_20040 [Candidatus Nitrotoga sp. AM1P]|nr:hypothetical protein W01_20040 [Candidatus Nitrotoga sp. AM1P]
MQPPSIKTAASTNENRRGVMMQVYYLKQVGRLNQARAEVRLAAILLDIG